jgi:hypothetical protein
VAAHSILAPSSALRWVHCPGSAPLSFGVPEDDKGAPAAEGTATHWYAAEWLTKGSAPVATVDPDGTLMTKELMDIAERYVRSVTTTPGDDLCVEQRLECTSIHPDVFGTCDAYKINRPAKTASLWDLKTGFGYVSEFENWQLIVYASGVFDRLFERFGPETWEWHFNLRIVQPRAWHRDGPVRLWRVSARTLGDYWRKLRLAAEEARGNDPRTVPGPWCKHCPGRFQCKALQAAALDAVDQANDATPIDLPPDGLSIELRLLRRAKEQLEARITGLEARAMSAIQRGGVVPNWTIEHTAGREEWVKPVAEVLALGQLAGINLAKPQEAITPKQARDAGVDAALVAGFSQRRPGAAKLIPIDTAAARKAFAPQ